MATELADLVVRRYFARQASRGTFELNDEILTVSERFEVVWPLDAVSRDAADNPSNAA